MGDYTFFFYGTLMAPAILHRIIHGQPTPEPWQKALLTTRPALLPGYQRYRVRNADYPAILPSPSSSDEAEAQASASVLGVVVAGLTQGDVWRLDNFEGSEYTKRTVKVRVLKEPGSSHIQGTSRKDNDGDDETALQHGLAKTAQLATTERKGAAEEMEEIEATTYVWTDPKSALELDSEWDFESFKRDKLAWWIEAPEHEL